MTLLLLIPACIFGMLMGLAAGIPDAYCFWKHGTGVHGCIEKYNQIQRKRWERQCERAKRKGKPPPAPLNQLKHPTTF